MESASQPMHSQSCALRRPGSQKNVNVGTLERAASVAIGSGFALAGVRRLDTLAGLGLALLGGGLVYRGVTGHCGLYQAVSYDGTRGRSGVRAGRGSRVEQSIIVDVAPEHAYHFWRQLDNLPRFFHHLKQVRTHEGTRSHWVAEGPLGFTAEWEAEIVNDKPNQLIAWRSLPGWQVDTAGSVRFRSAGRGRGAEIRVELKYDPPGGQFGVFLAHLLGDSPEEQLAADLLRLKRILEAGEATLASARPVSQAHQAMQSAARQTAIVNPQDRIEESSSESFPASDPPGWTTSAATQNRPRG